jgi:hypothetical protein
MPRATIKRVKVTGWHDDKDSGEPVARLKITFEGEDEARVTGKMHAYIAREQLDEWSASLADAAHRQITLNDLHPFIYDWLFGP